MRQLDPHCCVDDALVHRPCHLGRKQRQQGPEAFTTSVGQVPGGLGDEGIVMIEDFTKPSVDRFEPFDQTGVQILVGARKHGRRSLHHRMNCDAC